ncbi:MAG: response regulator transcription factor [Chloroflexi bacterium]|nr:response regulator transcription factor [Chloroflexota bacterium]
MSRTILIVDDEPKIIRFLNTTLELSGYTILQAENGMQAIEVYEANRPDLIILDLGLPDIDGLDVLKHIRTYSTVPVVILTARDGEADKVRGLELGADDYLTKPFGAAELEARIQAVLRRVEWSPQPDDLSTFSLHNLHIDFKRRRVTVSDEEIHLTPTEYDLLRVLVNHAGEVMLHANLLTQVWGEEYKNDLAILRVNISRLRQKLEADHRKPVFIVTVPGVGYSVPSE